MDYPWAVPGAKVVCVDAMPYPGRKWCVGEEPKAGCTYTVVDVWVDGTGNVALEFAEISRLPEVSEAFGFRAGYHARRFRPLITQADDIAKFTHWLNTTDEVVSA